MRYPKYVFFNSYKGGVGRTFLLSNLALIFKYFSGKKILIVDMDIKAPGVFPQFKLKPPKEDETLLGLLTGKTNVENCIKNTKGEYYKNSHTDKIFLLPASNVTSSSHFKDIFEIEREPGTYTIHQELKVLKDFIREFCAKERFDIIFVDFSAGHTPINIAKNVLGNPDLICIVFNVNQQSLEGFEAYMKVVSQKAREQLQKQKTNMGEEDKDKCPDEKVVSILPILNKISCQNSSFEEFHRKFVEMSKRNYSSVNLLELFEINFFDQGVVGEFSLDKVKMLTDDGVENYFEKYMLNSSLEYDRNQIFKRRLRNDGAFCFYEVMYRLYELVRDELYTENKKNIFPNQIKIPRKMDKIKILIEETAYSTKIKEEVKKTFRGRVSVDSINSDKILRALDGEKKGINLKNYHMISLPNFCLQKAIKKDLIISLEELIGEELSLEMVVDFIRKRFRDTIINVDSNGKTYGIPFTNISAVIGYNKKEINAIDGLTYDDILIDDSIKWGMVNSRNAFSHFYEFLNVLGAYGVDFFTQHHPSVYGRCNLDDERFSEALEIYLKLYIKSIRFNSWNEILENLILGKINCCFLWTEQLMAINDRAKGQIGFFDLPIVYGHKYNQGEGWFLCPVKKVGIRDRKMNILEICQKFSEENFQRFILEMMGASPNIDSDEHYLSTEFGGLDSIDSKKRTILFIQRILENAKPKPNFIEINSIMLKFSDITYECVKGVCKNNWNSIKGDFIEKLRKMIIDVLGENRFLV